MKVMGKHKQLAICIAAALCAASTGFAATSHWNDASATPQAETQTAVGTADWQQWKTAWEKIRTDYEQVSMAPGKDMDGSARHIFHKHNRMSMKTVVVGAGGISNAWLPVLKTAGLRLAVMYALLAVGALIVFSFVPFEKPLFVAMLLAYSLPAPYIIPIFANAKGHEEYISTSLSVMTLISIALFIGIAAYSLA